MKINGLTLINDFITKHEELELINKINENDWDNKIKRRVQHYGYVFEYKTKKVDIQNHNQFPKWLDIILEKLKDIDLLKNFIPDQCTINEYYPGIGISPHIDTHSSFDNTIISISLENNIIMSFRDMIDKNIEKTEILIPNRSLLIMKDDARYKFSHGISYRKTDNINGKLVRRGKRISITLRKILTRNCNCKWAKLCDSQEGKLEMTRL